jgi:hypothetical protein
MKLGIINFSQKNNIIARVHYQSVQLVQNILIEGKLDVDLVTRHFMFSLINSLVRKGELKTAFGALSMYMR